jgi:hypothetical protein
LGTVTQSPAINEDMQARPQESRSKQYFEYLMWFCFGLSVVLNVALNMANFGQAVLQSVLTASVLLGLELFWCAGVVLMGIGFGRSLRTSGELVLNIPKLWGLVRETKPNLIVWIGHYTNWTAATLQGIFLVATGLLPGPMRANIVAGLIDLGLTFVRCVPMQVLLRRAAQTGKICVTTATAEDIAAYSEAQLLSWGDEMAAPEAKIASRVDIYREGILVARTPAGKPVGFVTTILLKEYDFEDPKSWDETTDDGWCRTHCPDGKIMFGVDMSKMPDAPKNDKVYDALLLACMARMIKDDLKIACLGGRLPHYHLYADKMTAEEYLFPKDEEGQPLPCLDPQVRMYLTIAGVKALSVIPDYFPDPESLNFGVLLRWDNPFCSYTNHRWWRVFTSNQLVRNILAWIVPRAAAAEIAYNDWRKLRHLIQQSSL